MRIVHPSLMLAALIVAVAGPAFAAPATKARAKAHTAPPVAHPNVAPARTRAPITLTAAVARTWGGPPLAYEGPLFIAVADPDAPAFAGFERDRAEMLAVQDARYADAVAHILTPSSSQQGPRR